MARVVQESPRVASPLRHVPNVLTTLRLVALVPFVVLLARADGGHSVAAGLLFGAASLTDWFDGWLARRLHVQSRYGRLVDPLADRLLIGTAAVLLWHHDRLPLVVVLLIVGRDVLLLSGLSLLRDRGYELSVLYLGKTATFVLMAGLGLVMLTEPGTRWVTGVLYVGIALSIAAGVVYVLTVPARLRAARGARLGGPPSRTS
jgi:CDP-diacylglycerol--glycerol-3-phosphate 3-phosphatidyltransferase